MFSRWLFPSYRADSIVRREWQAHQNQRLKAELFDTMIFSYAEAKSNKEAE